MAPYVVGISVLFTLFAHTSIVVGLLLTLKRSSIRESVLSPTIEFVFATLGILIALLFACHLYFGPDIEFFPKNTFSIQDSGGPGMIVLHFLLLAATQVLWFPWARNEIVLCVIGFLQLPNCYM